VQVQLIWIRVCWNDSMLMDRRIIVICILCILTVIKHSKKDNSTYVESETNAMQMKCQCCLKRYVMDFDCIISMNHDLNWENKLVAYQYKKLFNLHFVDVADRWKSVSTTVSKFVADWASLIKSTDVSSKSSRILSDHDGFDHCKTTWGPLAQSKA
jgi:hypothetical protein